MEAAKGLQRPRAQLECSRASYQVFCPLLWNTNCETSLFSQRVTTGKSTPVRHSVMHVDYLYSACIRFSTTRLPAEIPVSADERFVPVYFVALLAVRKRGGA